MKELLESLQLIDEKIDNSRYLLTLNINEVNDEIYEQLTEASKEIKKLRTQIN